jgi:anion-transporting  ArsA/GET3 family ATPase
VKLPPPDAHALDFLARPDSIARFVDSKVTTWMLKPFAMSKKLGLGSLFSKGEKLMGGIAKVAGLSALQTMAEFLILIQDVMVGFHRAGTQVTKTIKSPTCSFIMVTAPRQAPIRAATSMMEQLIQMQMKLDGILVNRCMAGSISSEVSKLKSESLHCRPIRNLRERSLSEKANTEQLRSEMTKLFPRSNFMQLEELSGSMDSLESITQLATALG